MMKLFNRKYLSIFLAIVATGIFASSCNNSSHNNTASAAEVQNSKQPEQDTSIDKQFKSKMPMVIDFYADWCGPCRQFRPIFEAGAKKYKGRAVFKSINVDQQQKMAQEFGIQYLPTIVFVDKSGKEVYRHTGLMDSEMLDQAIQKIIK